MPVRETPAGLVVTGLGSLPARSPNTLLEKFNITDDRGTWEWGTSKAQQGYQVPVKVRATVIIENPDELQKIADAANLTVNYLARDAATAALELYSNAEQLLADEVKGKLRIEVSPATEGGYLVMANVLPEPATRRPASNSTIRVSSSGGLLRSPRFVNAREVGSITTYVAQQMHIAFDKAATKVEANSSDAVRKHIRDAFKQQGLKISSKGVINVPSGGLEFGGQYYGGGSKIHVG